MNLLLYALYGLGVGAIGSMLGIGGGVFLVPLLSLYAGVPIHEAIAASLVAIVATSAGAGLGFRRSDLVNSRLGVTLLSTTVVGAVLGGALGTVLDRSVLSALFGVMLGVLGAYLLVARSDPDDVPPRAEPGRLGALFVDARTGRRVTYGVKRLPLGVSLGFVAGSLSGLLGIGGGVIHVPLMHLGMGVPTKAAVATSTLMLGATACAGAVVYFWQGYVDPFVAAPIALGILAGGLGGSRLAVRVRGGRLLQGLGVVIVVLALQMLLAAFGVSLR